MQAINVGKIGNGEGELNAEAFEQALSLCSIDETVEFHIHSQGGEVFEGFRMFNAIKDWPGKTVAKVNTAAFSIASYLAMACDEIEIAGNGYFMIHNPQGRTEGDWSEHAKRSTLLAQVREDMIKTYVDRTGKTEDEVQAIMDAETFVSARQAIEWGLADRIVGSSQEPTPFVNAKANLPPVVYAALFGGNGGSEPGPKVGEKMTTEKAILTPKALRAACPKASNDFIVFAMEEEMDMEQATTACPIDGRGKRAVACQDYRDGRNH